MRTALLLLLLLAAACGAISPPSQGTVTGTVVVSPCRPVERAGDPPCPPQPGIAVHFQPTGGGSALSATTDSTGTYRVQLPAGDYQASAGGGIVPAQPKAVTVVAGGTVTLNFSVDSGIR
jgi:hypothetical protein